LRVSQPPAYLGEVLRIPLAHTAPFLHAEQSGAQTQPGAHDG
jgi:hypothetical protein